MEYTTRILIADESQSQRATLREGLIHAGYRHIEEASNGEEALSRIARNHPDIVLMDVWFSKMDGIGVLRNSKQINYAPDKPPAFIVFSVFANQNTFMEAAAAGAELCLIKPYNLGSLCEHINSIANNRARGFLSSAEDMQAPDIETQVTKIIHQIGVPAHIKGYQYLRTAILMTVKESPALGC